MGSLPDTIVFSENFSFLSNELAFLDVSFLCQLAMATSSDAGWVITFGDRVLRQAKSARHFNTTARFGCSLLNLPSLMAVADPFSRSDL